MIADILFPVDFSPASVGMAGYLKRAAALFGSRVTLLHVCDLESHNGFELYLRSPQELSEEHWSIARHRLDSFLEGEFPIAESTRVLQFGDPAAQIVEVARARRFDLIVMGTHAGRFRQTLLGSTTAKVLDDADCPVLTTEHAEATVPKPFDHPQWVCGIGLDGDSERVLELATRAAAQAHANLSVLHVADESGPGASKLGFHSAELQNALERRSGQKIRIVKGPVKDALICAAQRSHADVLIIGRTLKHGVAGRLRALTYSLIRTSPVPVLSV